MVEKKIVVKLCMYIFDNNKSDMFFIECHFMASNKLWFTFMFLHSINNYKQTIGNRSTITRKYLNHGFTI